MGTLALKADERVKNIHIDDYVIAVDLMVAILPAYAMLRSAKGKSSLSSTSIT